MRSIILFSLLILLSNNLRAQAWKLDDYKKWNHTNFRKCALFDQTFNSEKPDYLLLDAAIFFLTNEERMNHHVRIMEYQKNIEIAAYNHSVYMAKKNFFSHANSMESGRRNPSDRGILAGVENPHFAENIAYFPLLNKMSYLDVAEYAIGMWMNSPGHRSNILSDSGLQFACGVYYSDDEGYFYATQDFQWFETVVEANQKQKDQLPGSF
jgi:uncharacterized protein YkwD